MAFIVNKEDSNVYTEYIVSQGRFTEYLKNKGLTIDDIFHLLIDISLKIDEYYAHEETCVPFIKYIKDKYNILMSCNHNQDGDLIDGLISYNFYIDDNHYYTVESTVHYKLGSAFHLSQPHDPIEVSMYDKDTVCVEIYNSNGNLLDEYHIKTLYLPIVLNGININSETITIDEITIEKNPFDYCIYENTTHPYQKTYLTNDMVNILFNKLRMISML